MIMKFEEPQPCETINEIRQELLRLMRYDPTVRAVFLKADYAGMSGEDKYALLSYELMKQLNTLKNRMLDEAADNKAAWHP